MEHKDLRETLEQTDKTDSPAVMDRIGIPHVMGRMANGGEGIRIKVHATGETRGLEDLKVNPDSTELKENQADMGKQLLKVLRT